MQNDAELRSECLLAGKVQANKAQKRRRISEEELPVYCVVHAEEVRLRSQSWTGTMRFQCRPYEIYHEQEGVMEFQFDAVFYHVSDLDCAVRFYRDVLGFKLHSRDYVARFYIGDVLFELVPTSDTRKLKGNGNARVCLAVDDIQGSISELRAKGVAVQDAETKENGALAYFRDPDGNEVCLWQYVR
jgi:catechol 2,3-dioxygenase-like lactoylglutathione lyase family enzyme